MFAMCPGRVCEEPSHSKMLSITFKCNFRAPAPATPMAKRSLQRPRADRALGGAEPFGLCQHKHLLISLPLNTSA